MYLECFNGWQQLDLDTNLDKSTTLQMFMESQTLWLIAHQPVYTAKMQEAQVECPFMDSSFGATMYILETGSHISSQYGFQFTTID